MDTQREPSKVHNGAIQIGAVQIRCFVLEWDDGEEPVRLLSGRAVTEALALTGRGQGIRRFIQSKSVGGYLSEELVSDLLNPYEFKINTGIKLSHGYRAKVLPELCFAIMDAYVDRIDAEQNTSGQPLPGRTPPLKTYQQAKILAKAFSVIGIEALVDEATGFQESRDRRALEKMLNKYLAKEWRPWSKMFHAEFYQEIFRLRGWKWKGMHVNRPGVVAYYTTDLVYRRLAPKVLDELRARQPRNDHGKPRSPLFCGLSEDFGVPALKEHLFAVTVLMRASKTWSGFMHLMDTAYPRFDETPALPGLDVPYPDDDD